MPRKGARPVAARPPPSTRLIGTACQIGPRPIRCAATSQVIAAAAPIATNGQRRARSISVSVPSTVSATVTMNATSARSGASAMPCADKVWKPWRIAWNRKASAQMR